MPKGATSDSLFPGNVLAIHEAFGFLNDEYGMVSSRGSVAHEEWVVFANVTMRLTVRLAVCEVPEAMLTITSKDKVLETRQYDVGNEMEKAVQEFHVKCQCTPFTQISRLYRRGVFSEFYSESIRSLARIVAEDMRRKRKGKRA